jgi:hypothetical protein
MLPVVVIACQVLQAMMERLLPGGLWREVAFMDYGLHQVPSKMTEELQRAIDALEEPSLVVLGYGLCGNGLDGIRAGAHMLLAPRVDDCIALILGSRQAYYREFRAIPGTYYLSEGWLVSGSHPLSEYHKYAQRYGEEEALSILDQMYQAYERLALVAPNRADMDRNRPVALEVACFCSRWDLAYEEILGSDDYLRRLVDTAIALSENGVEGAEWVTRDFVVVPPGGEIRQCEFVGVN